jgi:hypothetical protein
MKKFFHDYSYLSIKLFVNQFAIAIFGIALFVPTFMEFETLCLAASMFAIIFYLFLIYMPMWEMGAKDRISVDVGKKSPRPHIGLLISLCANIPNLILAFLSIFFGGFRLVATLLQGMYWGTLSKIRLPFGVDGAYVPISDFWITYFIIVIPALLTCWFAYYMGYKNFKITSVFVHEKKKEEAPKIKK